MTNEEKEKLFEEMYQSIERAKVTGHRDGFYDLLEIIQWNYLSDQFNIWYVERVKKDRESNGK